MHLGSAPIFRSLLNSFRPPNLITLSPPIQTAKSKKLRWCWDEGPCLTPSVRESFQTARRDRVGMSNLSTSYWSAAFSDTPLYSDLEGPKFKILVKPGLWLIQSGFSLVSDLRVSRAEVCAPIVVDASWEWKTLSSVENSSLNLKNPKYQILVKPGLWLTLISRKI